MVYLELKLIVECNMLDKLADPLRLGFVSTFVDYKSLIKLTHLFVAISNVMVIYLVKLKFSRLQKLYMIQIHHET